MALARDTALSSLATITTLASRLLLTALLARTLAPAAYGQLVFAQWVMELSLALAGIGVPGLLSRFLPATVGRADADAQRLRRWLRAGTAIALCLCVGGFTLWLSTQDIDASAASSLLFLCTVYMVSAFLTPAAQGCFRYDAVAAGAVVGGLAAPLGVLLWVPDGDYAAAARVLAAALVLQIASTLAVMRLVASGVGAATPGPGAGGPALAPVANARHPFRIADLRRYAQNQWLTGLVASLVWMRTELGVLKWQAGHAQVAFYAGALTAAGAITQLASLVNGALSSHLVRHWHAERHASVQAMLRGTTQASLLLTVAAAHGVLMASDLLVPLLLGADFLPAAPIVDILAIASVAIASGGAAQLLQVVTDARFGLIANGIAFVVLLTVAVALNPLLGVLGAAIARAVAQLLVAELTYRRLAAVPGYLETARSLAHAQRLAAGTLLGCWLVGYVAGRDAAVVVPLALVSLAATLGLVRAIIGVPLRQMLQSAPQGA